MSYIFTPEVNSAQEFIEIANDFSNPLDLVREAISNSFDAKASNICLDFCIVQECGEKIFKISLEDDGEGMDKEGLKSFFDLGNSSRRETKEETGAIGEKGHGTKVYFNSKRIEVTSVKNGQEFYAVMEEPKRKLYSHNIPTVEVTEKQTDKPNGTKIVILGYNENRRERFNHEQLKDYILWFTKFCSIEKSFDHNENNDVKLKLKGVDRNSFEELSFGHVFPKESESVERLFETYLIDAPKWYCKKRIVKGKSLKTQPDIKFDAVFYVEGTKVKYNYNPMIKRSGYQAPVGAYTVQDRYGLWLCKDYIPVQRKNEWVISKGSEYTKFHAFVNCQDLRLTANRGSIENTPAEILQDLRDSIKEIYESIIQGDDWSNLSWLESEAGAYNTIENEKSEFKRRIERVNQARIAEYSLGDGDDEKKIHLVEPRQENGVYTIFMQLSNVKPDIFPFTIVDYDTHLGIDVIVKAKDTLPIKSSQLYYVEFKNYLAKSFNHSFENLHSIVCWDINTRELANGTEVTDIAGKTRTLRIIPPEGEGDYTRYYLDASREGRKIEIFVLKHYLREKYGIEFLPRTEASTF